jgi:hypothetical protein
MLQGFLQSRLKAASHLSKNRQTKGNEWRKCTKWVRIQQIEINLTSNYPIINYCQIWSTNGKQRINMTCYGSRFFCPLRAKGWYMYYSIKQTENERCFTMARRWTKKLGVLRLTCTYQYLLTVTVPGWYELL